MTFGEAFAKARKAQGPGGIFTWEGKKYTTDRADDKAKVTKNNIEKKDEPGDRPPKEWNIFKLLKKKKREEEPKELKRVPRSSLRAPERPPRYNIEDILDAIAQVETGGEENPDIARGLAGEIGRYQIKPIQGNWGYGIENIFKNEKDLEDPDIARAQARNILENYTKALGGDQLAGIIAYNRGVTGFNNAYGDGDYMNNEYLTNVLSALGNQGIMSTAAAQDI